MIEEWMIYRLITLTMFGLVILMLLSAGMICERMVMTIYMHRRNISFLFNLINVLYNRKVLQSVGLILLITAAALNYKTVIQYLSTGRIHEHWSKVLIGGFLFSATAHLFVTSVILQAIDLMMAKRRVEASYISAENGSAMKANGDLIGQRGRMDRHETIYHSS